MIAHVKPTCHTALCSTEKPFFHSSPGHSKNTKYSSRANTDRTSSVVIPLLHEYPCSSNGKFMDFDRGCYKDPVLTEEGRAMLTQLQHDILTSEVRGAPLQGLTLPDSCSLSLMNIHFSR